MPGKISKAYAINDAKIMFVSLVDKAANQKQFLITKSENGSADFRTFGRIIKADDKAHFVTGIVYEPMVEDSQGNYMTEEEITKAAHWFIKNGNSVDIQHSFEPFEGACVVESSVTKCDMEIEGQAIKKGTWLMTMEIDDPDVFESIQKGDITGFSMGGTGTYSEIDVDISDPENPVTKSEGRGIIKKLAALFGLDTVEKGYITETYQRRVAEDNVWSAWYTLSDFLLSSYNPETLRWEPQRDEAIIRAALEEFNNIVIGILTEHPVEKSAKIEKAGKSMNNVNRDTLRSIHDTLGEFLLKFEDKEKEVEEVTKAEVESIVADAIKKAMNENVQKSVSGSSNPEGVGKKETDIKKAATGCSEATEVTAEAIEKMVGEAIEKAMSSQEEPVTMDTVQQMISDAVEKAMEPIKKSVGLPSNLNNTVEKKTDKVHYLHGIL